MTVTQIFNDSICCIVRGSVIYGTNTKQSDIDMYCILEDDVYISKYGKFIPGNEVEVSVTDEKGRTFDIHVMPDSEFRRGIIDNNLAYLELLWQHKTNFDYNYDEFHSRYDGLFVLDPWKLRCWTSNQCNNSWAKCHKKMTVEVEKCKYEGHPYDNDLHIGRKSMWHVFRLYDYAEQILHHGKIIDYCRPYIRTLYKDIVEGNRSWENLKALYQQKKNEYASNIRKLADRPE